MTNSVTPAHTATGPLSPEQEAQAASGDQAVPVVKADGKYGGGKFDTVEALEKSYEELQKKLSQVAPAKDEESQQEEPAKAEDTESDSPEEQGNDEQIYGPAVANAMKEAGLQGANLAKEYEDNKGALTEKSYEALEKAGYPKEMVDAYLRGITTARQDAEALAEAQVTEILNSVGGEEEYSRLTAWMLENVSKDELEEFDKAVTSGNKSIAAWAVQAMHTRYTSAEGKEGGSLSGKTTSAAVNAYRSHGEMMKDMQDPRYKTDSAFRDSVAARIANSKEIFEG